jgi:hypothetical protein
MVYCTVHCSLKFIVYNRKRLVEYSVVYCTVHCSLKSVQFSLYRLVDCVQYGLMFCTSQSM